MGADLIVYLKFGEMFGKKLKVATFTLNENNHVLLRTSQASDDHFRAVIVIYKQED